MLPKPCLSHSVAAVEPVELAGTPPGFPIMSTGRPAAPADGISCSFAPCRIEIEPASMRADVLLEAGDLDGYAMWKRVLRAVEGLQGTEPGPEVRAP